MICTASNGKNIPIVIFGKTNKPVCFRLVPILNMPYTDYNNVCFDKNVTVWCINNVFWPLHLKHCGNVPVIMLLVNCTAHIIDLSKLPKNLTILFLTPYVNTATSQLTWELLLH